MTAEGRKIGKSLGNAVDPFACVEAFGPDAVRYYLLRAIPPFDDGDFSLARLRQLYNTDLANGLGNLVSRLTTLCERADFGGFENRDWLCSKAKVPVPIFVSQYFAAFDRYEFDKAAAALWQIVNDLNRQIETAKPWKLLKANDPSQLKQHLCCWLIELHRLAYWLAPLLPGTSERILQSLSQSPLKVAEPLFPRFPE